MNVFDDSKVPTDKVLTAQVIFDHVVVHLSGLRARAMINGVCAYRTRDGGACAVGALMKNKEADQIQTQGAGPSTLNAHGQLPRRLVIHIPLLERLQEVHDTPGNWLRAGRGPAHKRMRTELIRAFSVSTKEHLDHAVLNEHFPPA